MQRALIVTILMLVGAGCETLQLGGRDGPAQPNAGSVREGAGARAEQPVRPSSSKPSGEPLVTAAIFHFEEGNYAKAEELLHASIKAGLPSGPDRAQAHKYLAFIYCVTERLTQCQTEFRRALNADPKFALSSAEVGHPTWGPAFRAVQGSR